MSQIKLSQSQIILYLMDIERKLPHNEYVEYQLPRYKGGELPIEGINNEAKKMLDFVGLNGFTPSCHWSDLPHNVGGNIELNDASSGPITINISKKYKDNGYAAIAVLAHEICHKVLRFHGLYFPDFLELNEVYTDLCTMYVGFSQLILNGYKTEKHGATHLLGYLDINNYSQTERIVRLFRDASYRSNVDNLVSLTPGEIDIKDWIEDTEKRVRHKQGFMIRSKETSDLFKNITILKQLLYQMSEQLSDYLLKLDMDYFVNDPFYMDGDVYSTNYPIKSFILAHPLSFLGDRSKPHLAEHFNEKVIQAIGILTGLKELNINSCKTYKFFCPFCGCEQENIDKKDKRIIVRCPKCKRRFLLDCKDYVQVNQDLSHVFRKKKFWERLFRL